MLRNIQPDKLNQLTGDGTGGDLAASGLAGAGVTAIVAAIASEPTAGVGAAIVVAAGFIGGLVLYFIIDSSVDYESSDNV